VILYSPVTAQAATAIVQSLTPGAWATAGGHSFYLGVGQEVRADYVLYTDSNGRLHLRFADGSELHLGPSTSVSMQDYFFSGENTNIDLPANITALFLAGMDLPPDSNLEKLTQTAFYQSYKTEFAASWSRFQKPNLDRMSIWWNEKLAKNFNNNISYPFSGPDIMNVLAFFPDADNYILFGLEPVGTIPNLFAITDAELTSGLKALRKSLNDILQINFFLTNNMAEDIKNNPFNGISALLMTLLAKCGYTVIDAKNVTIDSQSNLVSWEASDAEINWRNPPASQRIPGVEITFRKGNGKTQTVRYFNVNVADDYLSKRNQNFIPYFMKNVPYATMVKSASYLMHNDVRYTKIREAILNSSDFIIQDDSGIPLRYFTGNEWAVSLHGVYDEPIQLFKNRAQPDLKEAYKSSTGVLPFSYGYGHRYKQNLLTASRVQSSDAFPASAQTEAATLSSLCPHKVFDTVKVEGVYLGQEIRNFAYVRIRLDSGGELELLADYDYALKTFGENARQRVSVTYNVEQFWVELKDKEYCERTKVMRDVEILGHIANF